MLFTLKTKLIASKNAFPVRPAHLARLQLLHDEGRLLTAGPMPAVDSNDPGLRDLLAQPLLLNLNRWKQLRLGRC